MAYIGMESGSRNESQVLFQEWMKDKQWPYQRNSADAEDPAELGEPKTMLEHRMLDKEKEDKHWQESYLYRLLV